MISKDGFPYSKVWVKEESVISNNLQSIFLILLNREDRSLLWMVQWSKKCEWFIFSTTVINDSANLENYAWIYAHEDDWDQHWVLLETWFLADYEIQMHCLEKVLSTLVWCFESSINIWVSQIRVNIIPFDNGRWKKEFFLKNMIGFKQWNFYVVPGAARAVSNRNLINHADFRF